MDSTTNITKNLPNRVSEVNRIIPIIEGEYRIEEYLLALENTKNSITLPSAVAMKLGELESISGDAPVINYANTSNHILDFNSMVEIYKVIYSRVVTFVGFLDEFKSLSLSDQKCLLFHNLESVTMVRLAVCFNSSTKRIMENNELKFSTTSKSTIKIWQIFNLPWASDEEHVQLYSKTVENLNSLPCFDEKSSLIFQMIALFSTLDLDISQLENVSRVYQFQEKFVTQLLTYLRTKNNGQYNNYYYTAIHKYLEFLPILRILSEKIEKTKELSKL